MIVFLDNFILDFDKTGLVPAAQFVEAPPLAPQPDRHRHTTDQHDTGEEYPRDQSGEEHAHQRHRADDTGNNTA